MAKLISVIRANWPAPPNVHALCTTRKGGVSEGDYSAFNLAYHVEDQADHVEQNRQQLIRDLNLPNPPLWLNQVHGTEVAHHSALPQIVIDADASYSTQANHVCAVMTADCLPILICNKRGTKVAAAHAGWRGLANGVIEASVQKLDENPDELLVWLGPAIGPQSFEVGEEVRRAFIHDLPMTAGAFIANKPQHYLADLYQIARLRLHRMGIKNVYGGDFCTYIDSDQFYSYRRDGKTGRQVSLIWFT